MSQERALLWEKKKQGVRKALQKAQDWWKGEEGCMFYQLNKEQTIAQGGK